MGFIMSGTTVERLLDIVDDYREQNKKLKEQCPGPEDIYRKQDEFLRQKSDVVYKKVPTIEFYDGVNKRFAVSNCIRAGRYVTQYVKIVIDGKEIDMSYADFIRAIEMSVSGILTPYGNCEIGGAGGSAAEARGEGDKESSTSYVPPYHQLYQSQHIAKTIRA